MKILMIANFVTFPWEGGNSRFTYILDKLDTKNNKVELITSKFRHGTKKYRELPKDEIKKLPYKITLLDEPEYKKNVSLKRFYSHYKLSRNLKKYLNNIKDKPDVIYCAVPSLDLAKIAAQYAHKNHIRFIIDVQDLWPEAFKMVFKIPIIKDIVFFPFTINANYIYKNANDVIAVSETYLNRAIKVNSKYENKASIFLGTELSKFDEYAKNREKKSNEEIVITYIGTLGHSYNLSDTIKAIKLLNEKNICNIKLKVMGEGPLKDSFIELANKLEINHIFTGKLPYKKMVQELCNCDIAINPINDGAAQSIINKVGDYAAAGLPVVNTQECEEYRNLVEKIGIGLNCKNNPHDISSKLEILIKDKNLREKMGNNNRKLAEEKFDRNRVYTQIIDLIQKEKNDNIEVLISTMNLDNSTDLINKMNIEGKSVIINQITQENKKDINITDNKNRTYSFHEKGLSNSRNNALKNSNADICVIADDDLKYVDNYEQIIKTAYEKYRDADIIAFYVENAKHINIFKEGRVTFFNSFKLCSVQLTFKKNSIINNGIKFDEKFGSGSGKYIMGEENIFLSDCLKKGLKIYYYPVKIAELVDSESTWFKGYNKDYFISRGACFYRVSKLLCNLLILQFAIRKYNLYKNDMKFINSIKYMLKGKKQVRANIFMVGDFKTNTGPAIVNKNYKNTMPKNTRFSNGNSMPVRILELFIKTLFSDAVCFCSFSKLNIIGIKLCKLLNKKTFYIMHGNIRLESEINNKKDNSSNNVEEYILNNVTKVFCVSKKLKEKMEKFNYNTKFDYIYNGIDWENITIKNNKKNLQIMSTGGDMPRKNNLIICKAIDTINKKRKNKIKYIVAGKSNGYKDEFLKYDFVEYYDNLNYQDCLKKMSESQLYIQNSTFETFGLAVLESLANGCDLLVSKEVGCIGVIESIENQDIISNYNDVKEIVEKINYVLKNGNNKKLISGIDKEKTSIEYRTNQLINKITEDL